MGQKVNPYGFRLGVTTDWKSRWFADREYADCVVQEWKNVRIRERGSERGGYREFREERLQKSAFASFLSRRLVFETVTVTVRGADVREESVRVPPRHFEVE